MHHQRPITTLASRLQCAQMNYVYVELMGCQDNWTFQSDDLIKEKKIYTAKDKQVEKWKQGNEFNLI